MLIVLAEITATWPTTCRAASSVSYLPVNVRPLKSLWPFTLRITFSTRFLVPSCTVLNRSCARVSGGGGGAPPPLPFPFPFPSPLPFPLPLRGRAAASCTW